TASSSVSPRSASAAGARKSTQSEIPNRAMVRLGCRRYLRELNPRESESGECRERVLHLGASVAVAHPAGDGDPALEEHLGLGAASELDEHVPVHKVLRHIVGEPLFEFGEGPFGLLQLSERTQLHGDAVLGERIARRLRSDLAN